jgi:[acyl-carrier-protein] S-malonyltransferase
LGKTAIIFPGQGSQYVGMGKGLWDSDADVRDVYRSASGEAGFDIAALSFEGPAEELDRDLNAQLAVFVCNQAFSLYADKAGIVPDVTTGYSLGFYNALVRAGCIGFLDGLRIVRTAGELCLTSPVKGTMGAVIGLDVSEVESVCEQTAVEGGVWVSNVNAARQVLISGSVTGVERAIETAKASGALYAYRLGMGAAYHTPLMAGAASRFKSELSRYNFLDPGTPLMSYIESEYIKTGAAAADTLGIHLKTRVPWKDTVQRLLKDGVGRFVEAGPGSALTRMVRWIDRGVETFSLDAHEKGE